MGKRVAVAVLVLLALAALAWQLRAHRGPARYTGFVEGEERIVRSEVTGRVLDVAFAEGDAVPAGAVLARLDSSDIEARVRGKRAELAMIEAEIARQEEQIALTESTWERDRAARGADVRQAEAAARVAQQTYAREQELVRSGASTRQLLDDQRAARDQADAALSRAREMRARADAEERTIAVARRQRDVLVQQREVTRAQLAELETNQAKFTITAPAVPTVVQTQLLWAGELAQPGTALVSVLDPTDKYVQVYVPVPDLAEFRVGRRVSFELDSEPGRRFPGEVSYVADVANFTPEKIETRSDRLGQVYRAKVRILEGVERLAPGTEGNVYLTAEQTAAK